MTCWAGGDLGVIVDRALDLLLKDIENKRLGKTDHPRKRREPVPSARVPSSVRREIAVRDGEQCTFVDERERRCPARAFLEFDHVHPKALGGLGTAANCRLLCARHNRLAAEQAFGRACIERKIHLRQRKRLDNAEVHLRQRKRLDEREVHLRQRKHAARGARWAQAPASIGLSYAKTKRFGRVTHKRRGRRSR